MRAAFQKDKSSDFQNRFSATWRLCVSALIPLYRGTRTVTVFAAELLAAFTQVTVIV